MEIMPNEKYVVGVDVGGTKVAAGLVTASGEITKRARTPMVATGTAANGLAAVNAAIEQVLAGLGECKVQAIGICSPGPLDPKSGVVINPPNLPCWRNFSLAEEVQSLH